MWGLRSGFYNYDDQMNMYVAVLAGGGPMQAELRRATGLNLSVAGTSSGPVAAGLLDWLDRI